MDDWKRTLLGLIVDDGATVSSAMSRAAPSRLDDRTRALVRVAAACSVASPDATVARVVGEALDAGAGEAEVVDVLVTTAPLIGSARSVAAAPGLAAALHYDVDDALESDEP